MSQWVEKEVSISTIKDLLAGGFEVEVESPDGWVGVAGYVEKGEFEEFSVSTSDGKRVSVNRDHLFKTPLGTWVRAAEISSPDYLGRYIMTRDGAREFHAENTGRMIPIVDIQVDHENHRYYAAGIESHNTGIGKTLSLCSLAANDVRDGRQALYLSNEISREKVGMRVDCNLLDVPIEELPSTPFADYSRRMEAVRSRYLGRLVIEDFPTATAGASHFRYLMRELRLKKRFKPDVVYVDYLNLCASSRYAKGASSKYDYVMSVSEELRGLAVEEEVAMWSATQLNREGYKSSDPGIENISDSFGSAFTADFSVVMSTSEQLERLGQVMVKQTSKNRYADWRKLKRFVLGIDTSRQRLYDVENSAQEDVFKGPRMESVLSKEKTSSFR